MQMSFTVIDMEKWPRADHYRYYTEQIRTSYQVTVQLNVSRLWTWCRTQKIRFYPAMIYAIMRVINRHPEFRMALDEDGRLGYYDVCHPSYTIFHEDDETFSDIWTGWNDSFDIFYAAACKDMADYKDVKGVKAKKDRPDAFVPISCLPWLSFMNFSHDTAGPGPMYFPVIVFGKIDYKDDCFSVPFSMMINHAAADGFHTSRLINEIEAECDRCLEW